MPDPVGSGRPFPLAYCAGGWETLRRLINLYERRAPDAVCAVFQWKTEGLRRCAASRPPGFCAYPDPAERAAFWDEHLRERSAVADDSVPSAYLSELDQGLYGALVGGEPRFLFDPDTGWISSMVPPLLKSLEQGRDLRIDPEHPWFRRYLDQMDVFVRAASGKFGISHFILIDSLNFVFELVGATKTYLALRDSPGWVRDLIDFAFDLNAAVQDAFFERVGLVEGGTCSNMVGWARGRIVNESVDPFHMTSVADFEQWGREPVERMFRRFDGGVLHIHGNGRHLLEAVSTIPGLAAIYLGDDKGYAPAVSILADLKRRVGKVPLVVGVGWRDFADLVDRHALVGGCQYVVRNAPDADAANRLMDQVRDYRF